MDSRELDDRQGAEADLKLVVLACGSPVFSGLLFFRTRNYNVFHISTPNPLLKTATASNRNHCLSILGNRLERHRQ